MPRLTHPDLSRSAILVIDMQEFFRPMAKKQVIKNLPPLLQQLRAKDVPVIYTQHGYTSEDMVSKEAGMLGQWFDDHIVVGTSEWQIMPEVKPTPKDAIIRKMRYSAFFNTPLEEQLRSQGVEHVIISGVMTNMCCETTARDAFMRDFAVFFLSDATGTTSQIYHDATLLNLEYGFATVLSCQDVAALAIS